MKKLSIKEIAELAEVSTATVSRVINNNGRFSKATEEKVKKVIKEHNYSMNNVAKSLRSKRSNTIGIIVPDISNTFFSSLVKKIEQEFFNCNYSTIICNSDRDEEKEKEYIEMLSSKMIDGLVFISGFSDFDYSKLSSTIPVVFIDREPKNMEQSIFIESDNIQGGKIAAQALLNHNIKKPLFLTHREFLSSNINRLNGFKEVLIEAGVLEEDILVASIGDGTYSSKSNEAYNKIKSILEEHRDIDSLFAINDRLAFGAIKAAKDVGLSVPEDMKVIGFDNDSMTKYVTPSLSSIAHNMDMIATAVKDSMLGILSDDEIFKQKIAKHQVIPVTLIKRESCN